MTSKGSQWIAFFVIFQFIEPTLVVVPSRRSQLVKMASVFEEYIEIFKVIQSSLQLNLTVR